MADETRPNREALAQAHWKAGYLRGLRMGAHMSVTGQVVPSRDEEVEAKAAADAVLALSAAPHPQGGTEAGCTHPAGWEIDLADRLERDIGALRAAIEALAARWDAIPLPLAGDVAEDIRALLAGAPAPTDKE